MRRSRRFSHGRRQQKNKKEASLPLHSDVAAQLCAFLAGKHLKPTDKVFAPLFGERDQFKLDLEAADVARHDAENRVADFHSLRHTFCTNLQRLGTPQRTLMHLMRHSDRRLSDHIYTDTTLLASAETVQKLSIPSNSSSQLSSQNLVPAGQIESQAVTTANSGNGSEMPINTGFWHGQTLPVTTSQNGEMVRGAGFEPATPTVSR